MRDQERSEREILIDPESQKQSSETETQPIAVLDNGAENNNKTSRFLLYSGFIFALWISTSINEVLASQFRQNRRGQQQEKENEPERITEIETLDEIVDWNRTDNSEYIHSSSHTNHTYGSKDNRNGTTREEKNTRHVLHSHTYSNCPFTMAKFSQYELGKEGPFTSDIDRLTNSIDRGKMALDFSNDNHAYDKVVTALQNGSFDDRKIVLDGDSLTRQLFISLGCMAWAAGYVDKYSFDQDDTYTGGENTIMNNVHYEASSKFIDRGFVHLKGGGKIYYIGNPSKKKIEKLTDAMVSMVCNSDSKLNSTTTHAGSKSKKKKKLSQSQYQYQARYKWTMNDLLPMSKNDVHVLAAGHHQERERYISSYSKVFQCMNEKAISGESNVNEWPHVMYQLSSVESFWTDTGMYQGESIKDSDPMTCQTSPKTSPHRKEERAIFTGLVPLIGDTIDLENLGQLHVWHGDCLHWLQPGIPDLYAAEIADYLISS